MKPKRRILSLLLILCLAAGLMPTTAFAAGGGKAIALGTGDLQENANETNAATIYFGQNNEEQPGAWRVIGYDGDGAASAKGSMTLLAAGNMDLVEFDTDREINEYATSDLKTSIDELAKKLTDKETAAVEKRTLTSGEYSESDTDCVAGAQVDDAVFWSLSTYEANKVGNDIRALSTEYPNWAMYYWWLRSPGHSADCAAVVTGDGLVYVTGKLVDMELGVRPAFHLDLNSVLFTSAAVGGKISTGADAIFEIGDYTGNEWKLTVLDSSRNFSISNATINGSSGTIGFSYSDAQTGTNEYISVVIVDNGAITHYGRILQLDGTTNGASGTASLTLPAGVTLDNDTKLYVFNEQYNGGENDDTKLTDYGSKLIDVQSAVDTTAPRLTAGTATRDSETAATVKFTSDEAGTYYYAVVESGAADPSIDTTGTGTACVSGENTISLNDLADAGAKDIYIVAKDAAGNVSQPLTIEIPAIYTLIVNLNGGNGATTGGEYTEGKKISIDAGTKSGYRFTGWTSSNGGSFDDASSASTTFTMPANDTTITANWKKKSSGGSVFFWDLKFDTNGGSDIGTVTEWEYSTIDLDEYVPEKEGYKFVGWYADKDLDKKIDEVYLTEDTTVYARWEKIEEEVPEEPEEVEETEETETISFLDVKESDWFYDAVSYAVENGLMSGMSEDIFAPNTPLTREMLAVVLYNVEGQPESAGVNPFTDVKMDMWYTDAIHWANENGIVAGYDNGAYGVGDLITREQFATILYRYAQFKGYDTTQGGMAVREFSDYENISDYARPAMAWAVNAGIMGGMDDGTLMPQGKATRAEAATMLMNFCENVMEK